MPVSLRVLAAPSLGLVRALTAALALSNAVLSTPAAGQHSPIIAPDSLFPYHPGIDVERYDFRITLPDAGREIRGQADIVLQRRRSTDTLRLDLREMTVDGVSVRGVARPYRRDSTQLVIPLRPADGAHLTVTIRWHGVPSDGLIITEPTATADDRGWRAFGDNWPNRARYWLPTVDHPSDKAAVRWTISAPATLQVVANGVQTMRRTTKGRSTWQFYLRQPIPTYLMVLGAARMTQTSLGRTACGHGIGGGCVPQSVWTFPQEASYVPGPFAEAERIVRFFSTTATTFPYERLAHLQSSTRFGGMENATAIFYSDNAFRNRNVGIGLIAHETAHQWFGNAVTPRRWADVWLSEGFATYWSALYLKASRGDSAYVAELQRMRGRILTAKEVAERPVVDSIGAEQPLTLLNRNSYEKGGFFLRLLHAAMGDSAFFGAARDYQRRYRHRTATTGDWQRIAERHAGRSLAPLFQQWLHRPGFADLTVTWATDITTQTLVLQVAQGPRFPPYDLTLAVVVTDSAGKSRTTDIHVAAEATQTIRLPLGALGTPARVTLDPDVRLLGRVQLTPAP